LKSATGDEPGLFDIVKPTRCAEGAERRTNMLNFKPAIDYSALSAHDLANVFPMIAGHELEELKADIAKNGVRVPITLFDDGSGLKILDGRNRYAAAKATGHVFGAANFTVFEGTLDEAEAFSNSANVQRRHLTNSQKREFIAKLISKYPGKSNRQIAKQCGFSPTTVAEVKDRLANPPELVRFREFKATWEELPDNQRAEFVNEFASDIRDLL
jgi:ParB/RepB/Spo0J family partition protein